MPPSSALFGDLFFCYMFSEPSAVDHSAGIGIVSLLITAADADGMGDLAGRGKGTVVIINKEMACFAAYLAAAFFIKMFCADMI